MGFLSDLFGGSSDKPKVQSVPAGNAGQMHLLNSIIGTMQGLLHAPGFQPGFPSIPGIGGLTQQQQGIGSQVAQQAGQTLGQYGQPLTPQSLRAGSQPYLDSLMGMFQDQVVPGIAGQFGALDSARSSGMANVMGRAGAQLPSMAQQQFLGQRQADMGNAFQGLGMSNQISQQAEQLNQQFAQGARSDALAAYPGMDPRLQQWLPLAAGSSTIANIGLPGSQAPSPLGGIGMGMMGLGAMGGKLSGAAGGIGSLLGMLGGI